MNVYRIHYTLLDGTNPGWEICDLDDQSTDIATRKLIEQTQSTVAQFNDLELALVACEELNRTQSNYRHAVIECLLIPGKAVS